jgi:DNA-binding LacI/PurR family transcriptional regulator
LEPIEASMRIRSSRGNATISDVARSSGVSIATVSNVLNNGPKPVKEATRQRVLIAAKELSYHPNATARSLVNRRTHTLGIFFFVVDSMVVVTNNYASGILQGVLTATTELKYNLTFFTRPWAGTKQTAFAAFQDGRADGLVIVAPPSDSDILSDLIDIGLTMVVVAGTGRDIGIPCVDVDDALGATLATNHLISLGHKRIAHISGDPNMNSVPLRRSAFTSRLTEAAIEVRPEYMVTGQYNGSNAYEQTLSLLRFKNPPTAIFAGNDTIAMACMHAARDSGVSVPRDLSIVGFDDAPASALVHPPLTSVSQPLTEIGSLATNMLVDMIERPDVDRRGSLHLLKPSLVVRESTAPPST